MTAEPRLVMAHVTDPDGTAEAEVVLVEFTPEARLELGLDDGRQVSLDWGELLDAIFAKPATSDERRAA